MSKVWEMEEFANKFADKFQGRDFACAVSLAERRLSDWNTFLHLAAWVFNELEEHSGEAKAGSEINRDEFSIVRKYLKYYEVEARLKGKGK